MAAAIRVELSPVVEVDDEDRELATGVTDIEIAGNREGLLRLAALITKVAESGVRGFHTHITPDDDLLRSPAVQLTVTRTGRR